MLRTPTSSPQLLLRAVPTEELEKSALEGNAPHDQGCSRAAQCNSRLQLGVIALAPR